MRKHKFRFVKKVQNCILMKNTNLILLKEKIQICILMKNTDLVKRKNSNLYFNEKYRSSFVKRKKIKYEF